MQYLTITIIRLTEALSRDIHKFFDWINSLSEGQFFLIFILIPLVVFLRIQQWLKRRRIAKAKGFRNHRAYKRHRKAKIAELPDMPKFYAGPFEKYLAAFRENKAEILESFSSMLLFFNTKRSIEQLEKFGLQKEINFRGDKEANQHSVGFGLESNTGIHASERFLKGAIEVVYRKLNNGRIAKRIFLPKIRLRLGFISSLDPATYDSDVTCYNCGAHFYLQKQQEKCPYCGSIYRFGGHRHLLNFVAFERNDYELKYAIFLIVLPILLPVIAVYYYTRNLNWTIFSIIISSIILMAIFALIAKVFMQRRQEKLQTKDLVFNNIKVAAEGYALFCACCFTPSGKKLEEFIEYYVHSDGKQDFLKLNQKENPRAVDFLLKTSHVDAIREEDQGQFLDIVLRMNEVRKGFLGGLKRCSTSRRVTLWRAKGARTKEQSRKELTQCKNCGGTVSLIQERHCSHCNSLLPLDPSIWQLYAIK